MNALANDWRSLVDLFRMQNISFGFNLQRIKTVIAFAGIPTKYGNPVSKELFDGKRR